MSPAETKLTLALEREICLLLCLLTLAVCVAA